MSNLSSKVILITGASSGIGEATARLLASDGAKLLIGARRTDRLEALVAEITAEGGTAQFAALDVTDPDSAKDFADKAIEAYGRIDVMINNAGVMPLSPLNALKMDEWNRMIDVNVKGVLHGIAATLPHFEAQGSGHMINIASIAAHGVWPTCAVYSATKYAVWAISEGLRQESQTVRVTTICPGVTESELGDHTTHEATQSFLSDLRAEAIPAAAIAEAIRYALLQPATVDVNEIIVRPIKATI
ncbi:SDR family oxidoreductase [Asticcacaulis sp. YBE204]|uniref:SDR family oxidoreductase n=1 Tax=Asticcacaulis sp. YBE204 TaxID=1282363 RepID=UPI0003C3CB19|nr:SDR family oxidoreductase [Asticcacaulis sp. YBE204]ESQ79082.1 hypothetical protein AEYBE204_11700 [Asticcacaulis sp. YBE204]